MIKRLHLPLFTLFLIFIFGLGSVSAASSKELRQQQKAAQKERQAQKNERTSNNRSAQKEFREFTKTLKKDYRDQVSELKMEFDLKQAELQADYEAKVAEATSENEKKTMSLFVNSNYKVDKEALEGLQKEAKIYSDELFALKYQFNRKNT